MGHNLENIDTLFECNPFFAENEDAFMIRFDYYCKPYFLSAFLEMVDHIFLEHDQENTRSQFRIHNPNIFFQQQINIDSVAQRLNTSLEQIVEDRIYIIDTPGLTGLSQDKMSEGASATLMIGKYYCCIYVENSPVDKEGMSIWSAIYDSLRELEARKVVSLVNLEVKVTGRMVTNHKGYLGNRFYGSYKRLDIDNNCSQILTYSRENDDTKCTVNNNFRHGNVIIDKEVYPDMWEQRLTLTVDYQLNGNESDKFEDIFNNLLEKGINFMDICVK